MSAGCPETDTDLAPLRECKVCGRRNRAQQRRGACHACYEKRRRAGSIESLVSAREAREHIAVLRVAKWNYREIARAARIDRSLVAFIVAGREKINAKTALAIAEIDPGRRRDYIKHIDPAVAKARARKAWETRRYRSAEAVRQRELFEQARQRAAQKERQREIMAVKRVEAQRRRDATTVGGADRLRAAMAGLVPGHWIEQALCAEVDAETFFPEKGGSSREAKAVCARCEVREQCLAFAQDNDERHGIWGGYSERERRRLEKESA